MLSKFEEYIYNKYLKLSRNGKPFKYRKDFSKISDEIVVYLNKISKFLDTYKTVDLDTFLEAPFKIYENEGYVPLQFYCTQKARKAYTIYKQQKQLQYVDSDEHINKLKESLKFVYKFCKENNKKVSEYLTIENQSYPIFLQHLKENKIDIYLLYGFKDYQKIIESIPVDIVMLMYEHLYKDIEDYYSKYITSKRCKEVITNGIKRLEGLSQ